MQEEDVEPVQPGPSKALVDRGHDPVVGEVPDRSHWRRVFVEGLPLEELALVPRRIGSKKTADLGRNDDLVARQAGHRSSDAPLRQTVAVERRGVEIAKAHCNGAWRGPRPPRRRCAPGTCCRVGRSQRRGAGPKDRSCRRGAGRPARSSAAWLWELGRIEVRPQEFGTCADEAGDCDPTSDCGLCRAKVGDRVVDRGDDGPSPGQQALPFLSERQGTKAPLDQGAAKRVPEAGDVGRGRRVGGMDPIRLASETSGIHDLQPRAQPGQFEIQRRLLNCGVTTGSGCHATAQPTMSQDASLGSGFQMAARER